MIPTEESRVLNAVHASTSASPSDHRYRERDVLNARRPLVSAPQLWRLLSLPLRNKRREKGAITDKEDNPIPFIVAPYLWAFTFLVHS
ncbi:hypothetical protein CEXT_589541 [Caerostris extrusa]|uniref:Uncharacterized protein n=1 Tax=Caerostris extrusa TaxID=172846 RepID=A0AAV4QET6_CAEEX|nr:hypothetical protein CEXT_589541 [Caerostris extrusa]